MADIVIPPLERGLRRLLQRVGLDLRRHRPEASEPGRLASMLSHHGVDLVFDVGANTGQFAQSLRKAGYRGRLVSFEPLSTAHAQLLRHSRRDSLWDIAPRVAIGDRAAEIEIHIAGNSVSSSVLGMLASHANAAPDSSYVGSERVRLARLDTMAQGYMQSGSVPFLKIDTQGYEDRVLQGAPELLQQIAGLQLELSLVPLYEGQRLYNDMIGEIQAKGFELWALWPGFADSSSGRMLQLDAVLFRR